jgi:geranylgeranyl diphosphate synthase type I
VSGPDILNRHRDAIEREVGRSLADSGSRIDEMLRSYLGWTEEGLPSLAKCLRPSLCLSVCEALGGDINQALPIAAAVELVHNFSLIHDDIEDGDAIRHHRPTLWNAFGRQPAIFAGVGLWAIAHQTLDRALETGLSPERVLQAHHILNDACLEMIEGQHQDISFEEREDVTLTEYIEMISRKSGALLGASLQLGALVAGCDEEELERFYTFGRELGLAFQIRDDVLGIWGEGSATGKPVGADIAHKKKSLPVVYAFQQVVGPDHDVLAEAYGKPELDDADINEVLSILQRWNCRYFAQGLAEDHRSRAMSILSRTSISPEARRAFDELMSFVLERDY